MIYIPWHTSGYPNGAHPLSSCYLRHLAKTHEVTTEWREDAIAFFHTVLPDALIQTTVLHIENPITLFLGAIEHGQFRPGHSLLDFRYGSVLKKLEDPKLVAVFSHSRYGCDSFKALFPSVAHKMRYIPLMPFVPVRDVTEKPSAKDGVVRVLFTNSYHNANASFWLRGGGMLLGAWSLVRPKDASLVLVSGIPRNLPLSLAPFAMDNVTAFTSHVTEESIEDLYAAADIFVLPSLGIHSLSLARAAAYRCHIICSDFPGAEEYAKPTLAIRDRVYFNDAKVDGVLLDNYDQYMRINSTDTPFLAHYLEWHIKECRKNPLPDKPIAPLDEAAKQLEALFSA